MAYNTNVASVTKTIVIDSDLSQKAGYFVTPKTPANDDNIFILAGAVAVKLSVLASGKLGSPTDTTTGTIVVSGGAKVLAGGTIANGDFVKSDINGKAITSATDTGIIATQPAVAGDFVTVVVQ